MLSLLFAGRLTTSGLQVAVPISDVDAGDWLPSTGTDLWAMVDETVPDDADYMYNTGTTAAILSLTALDTPDAGNVSIAVRARSV